MRDKAAQAFRTHFGHTAELVVRAPGRVNLLGGHTDYNDGFVLPVAIDRAAWIAAAPLAVPEAHIVALDLKEQSTLSIDNIPPAQGGWADYARGVAWSLQERGLALVGMQGVLTSNVPIGAGLSSSAAIEVAFAYTWQLLSHFDISRRELALAAQKAENDYVGVKCGILDQITSTLGRQGYALLFDCRTLDAEPVPLPDDVAIVVADSRVRRALASSEYNLRRAQCEQAVEILSQYYPGIRALRDVTESQLEQHRMDLPDVVYRRARHVVTENARVLRAKAALQQNDIAQVGHLMKACHTSLRDDYEVSAPELDNLAAAAWDVEGCYGARLTGAGFGGCIVALAAPGAVQELKQHLKVEYHSTFNRSPTVYVCHSANGVEQVS